MFSKKYVFGPQVTYNGSVILKDSVVSRNVLKSLMLLAIHSIEGRVMPEGALDVMHNQVGSVQHTYELYAGILMLVQSCLRSSQTMFDSVKDQLRESKFPDDNIGDLLTILNHDKLALDRNLNCSGFHLKLDQFRWRVDITISSSVLSRVLEPTIIFEMTLSNGQRKCFEVTISKFHQVRFSVTSVLKEMEALEKRKMFQVSV